MRKLALAAGAAIIVAGGAYYALMISPSHQLRAGLDQAMARLPPGYDVHYTDARYSLFTHVAEIDGVAINVTGTSPITETIAKITVDRPALDFLNDWKRAQADSAGLKPDQALPVADRIDVVGLKLTGGFVTGGMDSASLSKPRVYPWALLHQGVPPFKDMQGIFATAIQSQLALAEQQRALTEKRQTEEQDTAGADPTQTLADLQAMQKQQLDALLPLVRLEAAGVLGSGFDQFDAKGLDVTVKQPAVGAMPAGDFRVAMHTLHEGALDRGIGGESTADGLIEELGPGGKIAAEHITTGRVVLRDTATRLLNGDPLSMSLLDGLSMGGGEIDKISMTIPTAGPIELQSMSISKVAFDHGFLKSLGFGMNGLKQAVAALPDPRSRLMLQQMGLKTITLSVGAAFEWDAGKQIASFHDVTLKVDELGDLQISADLTNIDPEKLATLNQASLAHGTIRYDDNSLIDRLLSGGGKHDDQQIRQMRQMFATNFLRNITQQNPDPKLASSAKAVSDFATDPHSLTITLAPPAPIPLPDFKGLAAQGIPNMIAALGLTVTANQ